MIQELQGPNCIPLIVWLRYRSPECFKRLTCEFLMRSCPMHSWGWTNLDRQGVPGVITRKKCCTILKLSRFTIFPLSSKLKSNPIKVFEIENFKYIIGLKKNALLHSDEKCNKSYDSRTSKITKLDTTDSLTQIQLTRMFQKAHLWISYEVVPSAFLRLD